MTATTIVVKHLSLILTQQHQVTRVLKIAILFKIRILKPIA